MYTYGTPPKRSTSFALLLVLCVLLGAWNEIFEILNRMCYNVKRQPHDNPTPKPQKAEVFQLTSRFCPPSSNHLAKYNLPKHDDCWGK